MKRAAHLRRAHELLRSQQAFETKRFGGGVTVDASGEVVGGVWPYKPILKPPYPNIKIENVLIAVRLGTWAEREYMKHETGKPLDINKAARLFSNGIKEEMQKGKGVQIGSSGEVCSSCISQMRLDNEGNKMTQIFTEIKCNEMPSESKQHLIAEELQYALDHSIFENVNFEIYNKFNGVNEINPKYISNKKKVGLSVTAMNSLMRV